MIENNGRLGYIVDEQSVMTFQIGETPLSGLVGRPLRNKGMSDGFLIQLDGYRILTRGKDDGQIGEISRNIKNNRLLPEVIEKQVKIMYGEGLYLYKPIFDNEGKLSRKWEDIPAVSDWLNSWNSNGITDDYQDLAMAMIRRYYYFEDMFLMWRFRIKDLSGARWVLGLELIENSRARLATDKNIALLQENYVYDDFGYVAVGEWARRDIRIYPRLDLRNINTYNVAVSHHANDDIDSLYGRNKSYEGSKEWVEGANDNPRFIRSFLNNSLAAKVHVIIPNEWYESKRQLIQRMCETNRTLEKEGTKLLTLNGVELGTKFNESLLIQYTNKELQKLTEYLSGKNNQGKLFTSFSYRTAKGEDVEWKIQQLDLKYKDYIESLITFDRRADEVLVGSKGIDPSISNISKEGVISKSGSDSYYNYIIYQNQLAAPEKICCDAFNMALRVNFPEYYKQGYRLGFYRNVPVKQQDISPDNRLNAQ